MTDSKLEQIMGNLLRAGVMLAAAVVLAGGIWYLAANGGSIENYRTFHGQHGTMPWTQGLSAPLATIQIGLLLLIATPVARVVFSVAAFGVEHDRMYVIITLIVLAILSYSLLAS
ncbi:MAG TPA: DUF1634 domain-containing protein [Bryobacteraceae bacterium]|jgi:uncharacterized membrane protein|nr:DUF1634 domain-containing protein [Bryobacteraceae bacterium]